MSEPQIMSVGKWRGVVWGIEDHEETLPYKRNGTDRLGLFCSSPATRATKASLATTESECYFLQPTAPGLQLVGVD